MLPPPASSAPAPSPRAVAWLGGVLVLAAFAAYANGLAGPFVYDDKAAILDNPSLEHLWRLGDVLRPPLDGVTVAGRPILNLSFAINYAIGGTSVVGYHVVNVLIHALAGLALFGLVRRTFLQPSLRARFGSAPAAALLAFTVAALWVLHPLQTEAVSYVAQRAESLMSLFYLVTIYCFLRAVEDQPSGNDQGGGRRRVWLAASFVACLLGMATKENMVSAPVLVLLFDRTFVAGTFATAWRQRWRFHLCLAATWLLLAALVASTGGDRGGSAGFDVGVSWWRYVLTQFPALVRYLSLSVWPQPLVFDYGTFWIQHATDVALHALVVALLVAGTVFALWRKPAIGFLGAWFFAVLAPTSLVPGTTQMIVEHRMYLPLAAVLALVVPAVYPLAGRRALITLLVVAVALGFLTARRNTDYRSELAIWQDTVAKRPAGALAHYGLGVALATLDRKVEAMAEFRTALDFRPNYAIAHTSLGNLLTESGRPEEALPHLELALRLQPGFPEANLNLGVALETLGRGDEAFPYYERALRLKPRFAEAHNALGNALGRRGQLPAALEHFKEALRLKPDYADAHCNLACALLQVGRQPEANAEFAAGLRLAPKDAAARLSWSNALLTTGHVTEAITSYAEAIKLRPDHAETRYNLGNALAAAGRFADAASEYEAAIRLRPTYAEAHNNLGNALAALDRDADAIPHYEQSLRLKPANPSAHNNLGLALARSGRLPEAAGHFAEAVRLKPDYPEARENLARAQAQLSGLPARE